MVTKVQKMLNSLQTADPFETWHKNRSLLKVVLFVFKIFKMATNIKIKTIVKNSKIKRFPWKWIFTGSKTCCTILRPFQFAMVAILNPKWPPKYKNPPIWAKFGTSLNMIVKNWALIISCYVLTLFFIHTTSTCIVRLGDICNALRYNNQYIFTIFFFFYAYHIVPLCTCKESPSSCFIMLIKFQLIVDYN